MKPNVFVGFSAVADMHVPQPNLRIKAFLVLAKVLFVALGEAIAFH
ncbi:hypothetical protein [Roseofilum capinflatum]|uniref:Uncharacterized protein n=1 Tax=Roseofilum capinflatum BLCC-M114 TaxID=3022440 RepID=A0ABT7B379_9CYAN|nr:hypothetical protein [Roseofilum capinflatum]MDJ1173611.1 hypothetical protein [Roseofilum capinflatum BLCC-M114]